MIEICVKSREYEPSRMLLFKAPRDYGVGIDERKVAVFHLVDP